MNLYETLGIDKGAAKADIKKAYLKLAKIHHPDKKGGDAEKFNTIKKAFDVLYNENTRAEYDETGEVKQPVDERADLIGNLARLLLEAIDSSQASETPDLLSDMHAKIIDMKMKYKGAIILANKLIDKRQRILTKIIKKDGGENLLANMIQKDIDALNNSIANAQLGCDKCDKLVALVNEYAFADALSLPSFNQLLQRRAV